MNFFEQQAQARRKTLLLVVLFTLAVITLIVLIDLLFVFVLLISEQYPNVIGVPIRIHAWIAGSVSTIIITATLYKLIELRQGGCAVAMALGGRAIPASTHDPHERKLINVVEEMAIASGTPVPSVYLIDDTAINAFAAGYGPHDAVIGVTRGAIELLNRDELQGMIAHEFSHIFNGDMRLNLRLIGILFGILFLALSGRKLLHYPLSSREIGGLFLLGLILMLIGYSGAFFGGLIRAAVCRQREYLADAAAVQFTRNPEGIGGALKKIGGWKIGSILLTRNAVEYSHFYFAQGVSRWAAGLYPTHPPLADRITRIEPYWNGAYPKVERPRPAAPTITASPGMYISTVIGNSGITAIALATAITQTGTPTSEHLQQARQLLQTLPENLLHASHNTKSAYALALGLIFHRDNRQWDAQLEILSTHIDITTITTLKTLLPDLASINPKHRLTLIDLCLPQLKILTRQERKPFTLALKLIINADQKFELWEWALYSLFTRALNKPETRQARYKDIKQLEPECNLLLAALVYSSNHNQTGIDAYKRATESLAIINTTLPEKTALRHTNLNLALEKLNLLAPLQKPKFLKALRIAAEHNTIININEAELIRAIAACIDCPMPLLPGFSDN